MRYSILILICTLTINFLGGQSLLWQSNSILIKFTSEAPLEVIKAEAAEAQGLINPSTGQFAFAVAIANFVGFNSPLQQQHFHENYLESDRYPKATFSGRIIESIDLTQTGRYNIRAKGMLTIHGIEQERIIKSTLTIQDGQLQINSYFTVPLADHDIRIPRLVYQKIAEEIKVEVSGTFQLSNDNL